MARAAEPAGTLIYDDGCAFCRAVAAAIRLRDRARRLRLVPATTAAPALAAAGLNPEAARREVWFLSPDGRSCSGAAVLAPIARALPRWRRIAPLLEFRIVALLVAGLWILLKQFRHEL